MADRKPLYRWSLDEALRNNERELWRESYKENCICAKGIEAAIKRDFDGMHLQHDCAKSVITEFGYDRVNWVLANTLKEKDYDGRFSRSNKDWAQPFYIPKDEQRWHFCVESHPAVLDGFMNQARRAWQELGLFDNSHCHSEKDGELDYTGKVVVLGAEYFKDEFKTPDDQLFLATGGFGSYANSRGRKVYGHFLKDGEETHFNRSGIIGILKDEYLPEWAVEKLEVADAVGSEQENGGMTM